MQQDTTTITTGTPYSCYDTFIARDKVNVTSEEMKPQRFAKAQREFDVLVEQIQEGGPATLHDLIMWICDEGYRLKSIIAAQNTWNELALQKSSSNP